MRRATPLFNYASEKSPGFVKVIGLLRAKHPTTEFRAFIREDWRVYIQARPKEGAWALVKRVSLKELAA